MGLKNNFILFRDEFQLLLNTLAVSKLTFDE